MTMVSKEGGITMDEKKRFVVSSQTIDYSINNIVESIDKGNALLALEGIDAFIENFNWLPNIIKALD